jgi:hypothetical protein
MKLKCSLALTICAGVAFCLAVPATASAQDRVGIQVAKDHVDFLIGGEVVARYHTGPGVPKPYFWPLKSPGGVAVTRAWPMEKAGPGESTDHPHQKSAWFCHGDVIPEGLELKQKIKGVKGVDFWAEAKGHGRIVCTEVGKPTVAKWKGAITTKNEWRTADGTKILDEIRVIRVYDFGKVWLLVLDIDLHASVFPITFGDTKEGSMGVRVHDQLREKGGKGSLLNAEGKVGAKQVWGQRSAWCDYSGVIDGKAVGIAIFDDPENRFPACWHSRDYGLMAANPFGRDGSAFPAVKGQKDLVRLAKGERLQLRYGILVHEGDALTARVAEYFQRFVRLRMLDK